MQCNQFCVGCIPNLLLHIWHCTKMVPVYHCVMDQRIGDLSMVNGILEIHIFGRTFTATVKQMLTGNLSPYSVLKQVTSP
eukprot:10477904-Karenia_brevis.AAC.1